MNQNAPDAAASEQPAATIDQTAPASEQPQADQAPAPELTHAEIFDALEKMERGEDYQLPEHLAATAPAVAASPDPATVIPASEEPQEVPAAGEKGPPQRISVRGMNENTQRQFAEAAELVRTGQAADLAEAIGKLTAGTPAAPAATSVTPETAPAAPATAAPEVAAIATKIEELCEERLQAKMDYDTAKEDALTRQIESARIDLLRAEQSATARTAEVQSYQQQYDKAIDQLETDYPEAADETSQFYQDLSDKVDAAKFRNDPILADPKFILRMAADLKAKSKSSGPAAAQPQARATPAAPPARASRPVGSALAPAQASGHSMSPEEVSNLVHTIPYEDAMEVLKNLP